MGTTTKPNSAENKKKQIQVTVAIIKQQPLVSIGK